ncbi:hypothetical protein JCM10207_009224 [Rhodosporidiobolus poonsookiae]
MAKAAQSPAARPKRAAVTASPYGATPPPLSKSSKPSPANSSLAGTPGYSASGKKLGRPLKHKKRPQPSPTKPAEPELEEDEEDEPEQDQEVDQQPAPPEEAEPPVKKAKGRKKDTCAQCGKKGAKDALWVDHWLCVSPTLNDTLENVDKWFCSSCIAASASSPHPLKTTFKAPPPPSSKPDEAPVASPSASTTNGAPSAPAVPSLPSSQPTSGASTPTHGGAPSVSASTAGLRKSQRTTRAHGIDYANLDQHLPASVDKWTKVIAARAADRRIRDGFEAGVFREMRSEEITDEWVYGDGGMEVPFVVRRPEGLGMTMPEGGISVKEVAELVGRDHPLEVIDCASQSSLNNWNLGQWADYYDDPRREKVRNVISLEVSETRLGEKVVAPELVRKLDWVESVWPADMKRPGSGEYPRVQKYCLMSVERCWTDWHVDFAGSSVFYHILRGGKTFYFIRPTPANLKAYEQWSGSTEKQEHVWLGDMVDQVYRMELEEGNTAFIPTGWIHAVYTPKDALVIGGNFLHSLNIPTQLRIYQIELATKVPRKFRYPHFVRLLWFVALHYLTQLKSHLPPLPPFTLSDAATPAAPSPAAASPAPPTHPPQLPPSLGSPRVLIGLKHLSTFLIEQTQRFSKNSPCSAERKRLARENIPWGKIPDPVQLSREFRRVVLQARGEDVEKDVEWRTPHVWQGPGGEDEEKAKEAAARGEKRKADAAENGARQGSMGPPAPRAKVKHASFSAPGAQPHPNGQYPPYSGQSAPYAAPQQPYGYAPAPLPAAADAAGSIIGRQTVPVVHQTRYEERIDPQRPQLGGVAAEVKESRSTQSVVRRWERDPTAGAAGGGGPVVEIRTQITIVERVKWPAPGQRSFQPYAAPPAPSPVAHTAAAYSTVGPGPPTPAPPQGASTLTPYAAAAQQSLAQAPGTGMNPQPYPSHGYPYHYSLSNGAPQQQQQPSYTPLPSSAPTGYPSPSPAPIPSPSASTSNGYGAYPSVLAPPSSSSSAAHLLPPKSALPAAFQHNPPPPAPYALPHAQPPFSALAASAATATNGAGGGGIDTDALGIGAVPLPLPPGV